MILDSKSFDDITLDDLDSLIENGEMETRTLEYKQTLSIGSDQERKEFLADVSAFANSAGGFLIYGIKEENGIPAEICGIDISDVDAQIQQVENVIRDGIEPRIFGFQTKCLELPSSKQVLLIHIPKSWALPHWVSFKGHRKFYARNSNGKYPLNIQELRQLFTLSDSAAERLRNFRAERLGMIFSGETPMQMSESAKIVLHLIPFSTSNTQMAFNVSALVGKHAYLPLIGVDRNYTHRHNFDGVLSFRVIKTGFCRSYNQFFRNGAIEAVDAYLLDNQLSLIPNPYFESVLRETLPELVEIQKQLGVSPPIFVMLSLLGVAGYRMDVEHYRTPLPEDPGFHPIEKDVLHVPEVVISDFDFDVDEILRPVFDIVWNAASWPKSRNYDEQGQWRPLNR